MIEERLGTILVALVIVILILSVTAYCIIEEIQRTKRAKIDADLQLRLVEME